MCHGGFGVREARCYIRTLFSDRSIKAGTR
jgi:hypothetical protein